MQEKELIINYPRERLYSIMMTADFTQDTSEAIFIGNLVYTFMREKDVVPRVTEHRGMDLAGRCLISLGFFRKRMEFLNSWRGYPSPDFYLEVGRKTFIEEGKRNISEHLENWTGFLQDSFVISTEQTKEDITIPVAYNSRYHQKFKTGTVWKGEGRLRRSYELGDLKEDSNFSGFSQN